MYIPPNQELNHNEISDLLDQIPIPRLIVRDFNAHNPLWGSKKLTSLGRKIKSLLEKFNLNLLNDGQDTRFGIRSGEGSAIDLSICEPSITHMLSWDVLLEPYDSDHYPIIIHNEE
ncbi:uncharacterized protein [Diabrotica undecimpunctata]|uniref:uncharacterized protein n=1 Tax=Diabrotica undecimpunctata TaxID=50387 RepID=UPI003B63D4BF